MLPTARTFSASRKLASFPEIPVFYLQGILKIVSYIKDGISPPQYEMIQLTLPSMQLPLPEPDWYSG